MTQGMASTSPISSLEVEGAKGTEDLGPHPMAREPPPGLGLRGGQGACGRGRTQGSCGSLYVIDPNKLTGSGLVEGSVPLWGQTLLTP